MTIIDCHAHIFPPLSGPCGFDDAEAHLLYQQFSMHLHRNQPVRRLRDHAIVEERHLWKEGDPSETGRIRVNFRVGRCGRFEWEMEEETFYLQFLPVGMELMSCPADMMIAHMDYTGVDVAVLQNDHIYGNLSRFFSLAIAKYPGRFIGLAGVEEAFAYREDQIEGLRDGCERLDMAGLYFTTSGFFRSGYRPYYTDPVYGDFWNEVRRLEIPVFWVLYGESPAGTYSDELRHFREWLERYPDIPSVLVHGIPTFSFADADRLRLPELLVEILREHQVYAEVLYPISCGRQMEYPYQRAATHLRQVYDQFGAGRLLWGSDMPNVERYCTYGQSRTYLSQHCDFIAADDLSRILGGNTRSLFSRSNRGSAPRPAK